MYQFTYLSIARFFYARACLVCACMKCVDIYTYTSVYSYLSIYVCLSLGMYIGMQT